ncbi:putative RNA-directed DNA polymerase from transposon X-element [Orchesella cincta]|uniref:Putative RNA-directed DNA polymerase from transposon X-element n=1 Tax=Orchesella cincta TaxID=48709 RepID=A0A1D2MFH9_ORCCI|nr:putative RNA-directed DNA polymerase from transposon X-element [Orchesella cincta]
MGGTQGDNNTTTPVAVTLEAIYSLVQAARNDTSSLRNELLTRLDGIERRVSEVERRYDRLDERQEELDASKVSKEDMRKIKDDLRSEMKEEKERILRKKQFNCIWIPETEEGEALFTEVMRIIVRPEFKSTMKELDQKRKQEVDLLDCISKSSRKKPEKTDLSQEEEVLQFYAEVSLRCVRLKTEYLSNDISNIGALFEFYTAGKRHEFLQAVNEPTRGENILDYFLLENYLMSGLVGMTNYIVNSEEQIQNESGVKGLAEGYINMISKSVRLGKAKKYHLIKWRATGSEWHRKKLKEYKKLVEDSINATMKQKVQKEVSNTSLWATFKRNFNIKFKKEGKLGDSVCPDSINNYYCKMGFSDGAKHEDTLGNDKITNINDDHFRVKSVSRKDIYVAWKSLRRKLSKVADTTGINKFFLDKIILLPSVTDWLLKVVRISFESGEIPDFLKLARVVPLPKVENASLPADFRPISILSILLLIMEKVYFIKLMEYLEARNVLSKSQFGCRKAHSTEAAMAAATDYILKNVDGGLIAILVSIDLRKAFDSVHREKLKKLGAKYGISSHWLRGYLKNRFQFFKVNGKISETKSFNRGACGHNVIFVGSVNKIGELKNDVEQDMATVCNYFRENLLTLNGDKTKMITLSSRLVFDRTLSWRDHIENTVKICFIRLRTLYSVRDAFNIEQLKTLSQAFILSLINYMLLIVGATNKKYLKMYDRILRGVARMILRVRKFDPIAQKINEDLSGYFCTVDNAHQYETRRRSKCTYLFTPKLEIGSRVLQFKAVRLWNRLPEKLRDAQSLAIFSKNLKKYLLDKRVHYVNPVLKAQFSHKTRMSRTTTPSKAISILQQMRSEHPALLGISANIDKATAGIQGIKNQYGTGPVHFKVVANSTSTISGDTDFNANLEQETGKEANNHHGTLANNDTSVVRPTERNLMGQNLPIAVVAPQARQKGGVISQVDVTAQNQIELLRLYALSQNRGRNVTATNQERNAAADSQGGEITTDDKVKSQLFQVEFR